MDYKILIPLVGVILGWALGSLSGFFKTRNENKRLIGKSISQLYYFIFELKTVIPYLEKVKDNMSTEQYESHRQYVIERHTLKNENSSENINEIIDNISSIYPMLGIELRQLLEGYLAQRKIKFDSSKYEKKLYLLMLSTYEVHRDLTIDKMEEILIKLSFKHNIMLGYKMKKNIRNQNVKLKDVEKSVIDSIISDIDEEFQKVKNKSDNN